MATQRAARPPVRRPVARRSAVVPLRAGQEPVCLATLESLCAQVGDALVHVLIAPRGLDLPLRGVRLFDPLDARAVREGEVVLGVGIDGARRAALDAVEATARGGGVALVLKARPHVSDAVVEEAERLGVALLCVTAAVEWGALHALMTAATAGTRDVAVASELGGASDDLSALAEATAAVAGGPVIIEDAQLRMLAYSRVDEHADPERVASILARRTPQQVIDRLHVEGIVARVAATDGVLAFTCPDMRPRRAVAIRAGGVVLGYVWVVQGATPLTAQTDAALSEAARFASTHLMRQRVAGDVEQRVRGDLLRTLLGGEGPSEVYARELGLPAHGTFTVVAYDLGDRDELPLIAARTVDLVSMHFRSFRRHAVAVAEQGTVYALVVAPDEDELPDALGRVVRESLASIRASLKLDAFAGIGTSVARVGDVPKSHRTALQALRTGEHVGSDGITDIEDVRGDSLVLELAEHVAQHPRPLSRELRSLYEHDELHGTNYVETLTTYLDYFGNSALAAERLHIHPNTLRYRVRRLIDVIGVDLERPGERFPLELQLRLVARRGLRAR